MLRPNQSALDVILRRAALDIHIKLQSQRGKKVFECSSSTGSTSQPQMHAKAGRIGPASSASSTRNGLKGHILCTCNFSQTSQKSFRKHPAFVLGHTHDLLLVRLFISCKTCFLLFWVTLAQMQHKAKAVVPFFHYSFALGSASNKKALPSTHTSGQKYMKNWRTISNLYIFLHTLCCV